MYNEKELHELQKKLKEINCTCEIEDYKKKRAGATSFAHAMMLHNLDSEELIIHDVEKLSSNYGKHTFHLKIYDISKFALYCDSKLLFEDSFDYVEYCYQENYKKFYNTLENKLLEH
jgi:hypothetical protein